MRLEAESRLDACRDAMFEALQEIPFGEGMRGVVVLREALKGPARIVEGRGPVRYFERTAYREVSEIVQTNHEYCAKPRRHDNHKKATADEGNGRES